MGEITVIGLGPGNYGYITVETLEILRRAEFLLLRTEKHPTVSELKRQGLTWQSYDYVYEQAENFEQVYSTIANDCINRAKQGQKLVYAVPGSPQVAEKTVVLLRQFAAQQGITLHVLPGMSFLDVLFNRLALDPITGITVIDANDIQNFSLNKQVAIVVTQVYDRQIASDTKLALMELYPDEYEIVIAYHIGLSDERLIHTKLYELDRFVEIDHLTSVYVPALKDEFNNFTIEPLIETMARLRSPNGCPWDIEQTHRSLRRYMIEEVYEALEAIDSGDAQALCEELGDVLLQVVFHARIAEETGTFTMQDVIDNVTQKLIRRHPHVFSTVLVQDSTEVMVNWEKIKKTEKNHQQRISVLDGIPQGLPALMRAYKLQAKAAKVGFDWTSIEPVWEKISEELFELRQAINDELGSKEIEGELGDVLFAVVNLARFLNLDSEVALTVTNNKFLQRFSYIEESLKEQNLSWDRMTLPELDKLWEEAKKKE